VLFLDETGAVTNLLRTYGRSLKGSRCLAYTPNGHWKVITAVAAIRLGGMAAAATMACPMDAELFQTYLREALVPVLRPGDVVVMDNLASHKQPKVRQLIESAGATVLYLPPYSPDFNPIEMVWSKVKRLLRSAGARTVDALHEAFGEAMSAVTSSDILGCYQHCGYATTLGTPLYWQQARTAKRRLNRRLHRRVRCFRPGTTLLRICQRLLRDGASRQSGVKTSGIRSFRLRSVCFFQCPPADQASTPPVRLMSCPR
jgi:transposase